VAETGDAASPSTSEPEVVRGGFDPPSPGTYRYRAETDGTPRTERITYVVLSRGGSETRLRESSDGPAPVANELSWRADGVLVVNPESCDEEGAKVRYVFPMSVGRTWSSDTTCSNEDMGEVRTRATMRILDHTEIGIAGQTVQAWVISVTGKTEVTLRGVTQTHHTDGTEWFSSARGLIVKWVGNTRQTESKAGAVRGSETRELLNLEPE
jgi:hypothetical protein